MIRLTKTIALILILSGIFPELLPSQAAQLSSAISSVGSAHGTLFAPITNTITGTQFEQIQQTSQTGQESGTKKRKGDDKNNECNNERATKQSKTDADVIDLTGDDEQPTQVIAQVQQTSPSGIPTIPTQLPISNQVLTPLPLLPPFSSLPWSTLPLSPFSSVFSGLFGNPTSSSSSSSSSSSLNSPTTFSTTAASLTPTTNIFPYPAPIATSPYTSQYQRLPQLTLTQSYAPSPVNISPLQLPLGTLSMALATPSPRPSLSIAAAALSATEPIASSSSSSAGSGLSLTTAVPQQTTGAALERFAQELFQKSLTHLQATDNIAYHQALARNYRQASAKKEYELGQAYEQATYGQEDLSKALTHFTRAAEQGHAEAQCKLGMFYERGLSSGETILVEPNIQQAVTWHKKACAQNYQPAYEALKRCAERIKKLQMDITSTIKI
jgi:hypothetical protein